LVSMGLAQRWLKTGVRAIGVGGAGWTLAKNRGQTPNGRTGV
jgi:hypothetical protein